MRLLSALLFIVTLFVSSGSIITRDEADQILEELDEIGETTDLNLLDQKAILCNSLALFYQSISDNEQAVVFIQKAITHSEKRIRIKDKWDAQDYHDLKDLYLNLARVQGAASYLKDSQKSILKAEEYFNKLKTLVTKEEMNKVASGFYGAAFASAYHSKQYVVAEAYANKALKFAQKIQSIDEISEANRNLGELYNALGDNEKALHYFDAAILTIRENDPKETLAQNLIRSKIGILYKQKRYEEVIDFMQKEQLFSSIDELQSGIKNASISEYPGVIENAFILSYAFIREFQHSKKEGYLNEAQTWQSAAYELAEFAMFENGIDRLGNVIESPDQKITSTLKNYELLEEANALSQEEIAQLLRTIDVHHASQLHVNRLKNELNEENWNKQKRLRIELEENFNALRELDEDDAKLDSLKAISFKVSSELAHLSASTKRDEIAEEYKLGQQDFVRQIDQYTRINKKTILTYFWSQRLSRLYIIGKNPTSYFFKTVEVDGQFMATVNASYQLNARFLTGTKDLKKQDSLNNALYDILISPVKKELTSTNLLVYPIGPMSYVSIDALRPSATSYMIEKFNTSYTSSLFALLRKKKKQQVQKSVSAFYPKKYGTDSLAELFHAKDEIATLDSCVKIKKFEGSQATKQHFLEEQTSSRILHIASHSILDAENPYDSYLIFEARDSTNKYHLKASEIFAQTFDADLVVLSSCNSAKGTLGKEIGIISLSNAFYFSGVPSTLGSLWSAQDNSSSKIISDFYRNLFQNKVKSTSLSEAKRNYLSQADAVKRQPFFWANYVMYGADDPVIIKEETSNWVVYLPAILLFMLIPFAIYKRSRRSLALAK